jgi:cysteine-S-conjugate beta-lyase
MTIADEGQLAIFDDLDVDVLRRRSGVKWAKAGPGVLPAWIADMDFPIAPSIREVVLRAVSSDDLGYPLWDDHPDRNPLREAFSHRMGEQYGFSVDPGQVREFTDLIQALQVILHVATRPGDAVAMHTPGYPPFLELMGNMGRRLVPIPMTSSPDRWEFDRERLADDVARQRCRALVLVNPHNPTGRVFSHEELAETAEIAERHDLLVIADEIHADLTYQPHRHICFGSLSQDTAGRTVTITSATKAFNIAGLRCAVAHLADQRVRNALDALPPSLFGEVSALGVLATVAAWQGGEPWLATLRAVLDRNRKMVSQELPAEIGFLAPQAGYLAWLDCRRLGIPGDPAAYFLDEAKVKLSPGPDFGPGGQGFTRLNYATSEPILQEILHRIRNVVQQHSSCYPS